MNRREFGKSTAVALPLFLPRRVLGGHGQLGANDRIRVGVIGAGNRSNLLMDQLPDNAEIVAVADCFLHRAREAAAKRNAKWRIYQHHRQLLEQKDIDGVIVGTREHQRVLVCVDACMAGKDIYAEKPLSLYVAEGRALVKAVRQYGRVLQVGSQQRSMAMNQVACDFVKKGGLGRILFVQAVNYAGPRDGASFPPEPVPEGFDWDLWLNQVSARPYSSKVMGTNLREFGGGEMTNWGAHGLDQVQMALGMDATGPVLFRPWTDGPPGAVAFQYANGVTVRLELPQTELEGGAIFVGEKGRIEIIRNHFRTDRPGMIKELPPAEEVEKWKRAQWQAKYHIEEWLDSMRSRKLPSADVEVGHRSTTICHLANLTRLLGRQLRWDPVAERVLDDEVANRMLDRERRKGYELPRLRG